MRSIVDKLNKIYPLDEAVIYLQNHCKSSESINRESLIECAYLGHLTLSIHHPRPFNVKVKMSNSPMSDTGIVWKDGELKGHYTENILSMECGVYSLSEFELGERQWLSRRNGWVIKGNKGDDLRLMTYWMDGPHGDIFHGIISLPSDARIVIKESDIESFVLLLQGDAETTPIEVKVKLKPVLISQKNESNNLKLIAALVETLIDKSGIESEAKLIEFLGVEYKENGGFSKRALETKFAEAKRQL